MKWATVTIDRTAIIEQLKKDGVSMQIDGFMHRWMIDQLNASKIGVTDRVGEFKEMIEQLTFRERGTFDLILVTPGDLGLVNVSPLDFYEEALLYDLKPCPW